MNYIKCLILHSFLLLNWTVQAQQEQATPGNWPGTYQGSIQGTPAQLTIEEKSGILSGKIDASGYIYLLNGALTGGMWNGQLQDPQTQGQMQFQASLSEPLVNMEVTYIDPATFQQGSFQLQFTRGEALQDGQNRTVQSSDASGEERDPRLVGVWSYTDSYTSGEFSFASQYKMQVNPDGTYLYGDGRVVGGGPGISGDSGGGGEVIRGQWKTQNQTIYINEGFGWQPYAGYYIEGASLMLKFADGSRQVWKRVY